MAKLEECQFIQIKIDGKALTGTSEESEYQGWMEGYASGGLQAYSGTDGVVFDAINVSLLMTPGCGSLLEAYLRRGYKNIDCTVVTRSSDKFGGTYESLKIEYTDTEFEGRLFLCTSVIVRGTVRVTMQVPNDKDTGLEKVGPICYDIAAKKLI